MLSVLISWCWIGLSAFLWGIAGVQIIRKISGYEKKALDLVLMLGLCFLTVYAQIFSLFYKVGAVASFVLLLINISIVLLWKKDIIGILKQWLCSRGNVYRLVVLGALALVFAALSATVVLHYDTSLYHAQSIRWIEEYGIVPGMGNLHNRLAYNSSFFTLQALFSLSFLQERSLHSMNGFVVLLLVGYAVCTFKIFKIKKFCVSDFFRVCILIFATDATNILTTSSSGSDHLALGLVVYILTKWVNYMEDDEKEIMPYAVLCLLGIFAISVKLSSAMIVLLVIMPAVQLIRQKKWKQIASYISLGLLIIIPFLVRNVIISGYLVYPYPELDLFDVDWKMPEYTLIFDRNEIKAWGMGLNDVYQYNVPISVWFPVWRESLGSIMSFLFYLNIILVVPVIVLGSRRGIRQHNWNFLLVAATELACLFLWFWGSPLPRYGSVFLILLPLHVMGELMVFLQRIITIPGIVIKSIFVAVIMYYIWPFINYVHSNEVTEVKAPDYAVLDAVAYTLDTEIIYVPAQGDQMSYHAFPSTPYAERLLLIEMRGDTLAEGFKMKDELQNAFVTTYGQVHAENVFETVN